MPIAKITSSDVTRIINSDEIQSVVRPKGQAVAKREFLSIQQQPPADPRDAGPFTQKKNPLRNKAILFRLNPYAKTLRRQELVRQERKAKAKTTGSTKKSVPGNVAGKQFLDILKAP